MSKEEAAVLVKLWYEHKLMNWSDENFAQKNLLSEAMVILGNEKVNDIINSVKRVWLED